MRVALITGASSGFGLATSKAFLDAGIAVVAVARDRQKLDDLEKQCTGRAAPLLTVPLDITADAAPNAACAAALEHFGRLDHLVNNAGIGSPKPVHLTDDEMLDSFLGLMLRAPFRFAREALTVLGEQGTIVNVSSTYALVGGLNGGAYSAAKAGLIGLTQHMACQYGSAGIRSNAVAPGVIPTPMTQHRMENEQLKRLNHDMTPSHRGGRPEDVAQAILFLSSPNSGWINGQVLAVDGGWSTTKYLSEPALSAERTLSSPDWSHAGGPPRT